jgi:hypothetical protein
MRYPVPDIIDPHQILENYLLTYAQWTIRKNIQQAVTGRGILFFPHAA